MSHLQVCVCVCVCDIGLFALCLFNVCYAFCVKKHCRMQVRHLLSVSLMAVLSNNVCLNNIPLMHSTHAGQLRQAVAAPVRHRPAVQDRRALIPSLSAAEAAAVQWTGWLRCWQLYGCFLLAADLSELQVRGIVVKCERVCHVRCAVLCTGGSNQPGLLLTYLLVTHTDSSHYFSPSPYPQQSTPSRHRG